MKNLIKNSKGAVTVFVTLLLIPAMLISGSVVDLARIHTASSIIQDSNQLAANAVLSQYNALLHDLYGLFGFMADDPELEAMVNKYIEVSVFGDDWNGKGLGTFQLFYGSNLRPAELNPAQGKDLSNPDVLRRQIEEYMKFRAPFIIVTELLDSLINNNLKEDTKIIDGKLAIDSDISELYDIYKQLYDAILIADQCILVPYGVGGGYFSKVSESLCHIYDLFVELADCYRSWELSSYPDESADFDIFDVKTDYENRYIGILENIRALTVGGLRGNVWINGGFSSYSTLIGLTSHIQKSKNDADNFKVKFDNVLAIAREIDARHDELNNKLNTLENDLRNGDCSKELSEAFLTPDSDGKSQIDHYREILKWKDIAEMAGTFRTGGYNYLDNIFKPMLDNIRYRNSGNMTADTLSLDQLADLMSIPSFALSPDVTAWSSKASYFCGFAKDNVKYSMPAGFSRFSWIPGRNEEFFNYLKMMMTQPVMDPVKLYDGQGSEGSGDAKKKQTSLIDSVLELAEAAYEGLTNHPLGAEYIYDPYTQAPEKLGILDIAKLIPAALKNDVVDVIDDPLGSLGKAGDYMLLLTYCTTMFSDYTTTRPESIGKTRGDLSGITFTKSLTGVPISPEVNYFFQSELEYLFHGSLNAGENLNAVTKLIFIVRLLCNYISVFRVSEVTAIVNGIRLAFAWCPPVGISLSELARAAFVAAETVLDVASLRGGHKVPLLKNPLNGEWLCSPLGLAEALANLTLDDPEPKADEKGLSYSQYLTFFFIADAAFTQGSGDVLAARTAKLIEWNVTNYQRSINSDETQMTAVMESDGGFRMEDMKTDFSISSTVDIRMLFLSMPMAQKGIGGLIPPKSKALTVTDYRGY